MTTTLLLLMLLVDDAPKREPTCQEAAQELYEREVQLAQVAHELLRQEERQVTINAIVGGFAAFAIGMGTAFALSFLLLKTTFNSGVSFRSGL